MSNMRPEINFQQHFLINIKKEDDIYFKLFCLCTWEQRAASSWKVPLTKSQNSRVVIWHCPRIPRQQGCPITSQTMCSASDGGASACSFRFRQIGHFVISSGQMYGAMLAGASQNLNIKLFKLLTSQIDYGGLYNNKISFLLGCLIIFYGFSFCF